MGVFGWLRRGSSAIEAAADTSSTESAEAATSGTAQEEPVKPAEPADGVGIPKQQSADEAADSETGESARN